MQDLPVLLRQEGSVAILTLHAPGRRNALSTAMRNLLAEQLCALGQSDEVRAVVLTGAGGHFCSGGDVSEMAAPGQPTDPVIGRRRLETLHAIVRCLAGGAKPVVAAVEGTAFGAGMSFALACDWIIAAQDASFGAAFGKLGLIADSGLLWTLPRRVGDAATRDILLTARTVRSDEALRLRMVDEVVPPGQALAAALRKCEQYGAVAPRAIAATKATMVRAPASLDELLLVEADVQLPLALSRDHEEARRAFLEKRPAIFTGR